MKICLQVQSPSGSSALFEHAGPVVTLGRNPDSGLAFDDTQVVSWDHVRIDLAPGRATLRDLGSSNGTYLNGRPVTEPTPLNVGDSLRLGQAGPALKVLELDLRSPAVAAAKPIPVATAVPAAPARAVVPARATAPKVAAAKPRAMSETRGILLEEIRRQREQHSGHRRTLAGVAGVLLALVLLLGVGLFIFGDRLRGLGKQVDVVTEDVGGLKESNERLSAAVNATVTQVQEQARRREDEDKKLDEVIRQQEGQARQLAREGAERDKLKGNLEGLQQRQTENLNELNQRLATLNKPAAAANNAAGKAPAKVDAQVAPAPAPPADNVSFAPGQKIELILKSGKSYRGSLVSVTPEKLRILYIEDAAAKPKEYDMREVMALQTKDGVFAMNKETGTFESALTHYKFNPASESFERIDASSGRMDTFRCTDAMIEGESPVRCLWSSFERYLALPVHGGPTSIPAYRVKTIVTPDGVHEYDASKHDFTFKSHEKVAEEINAIKDAKRKQEVQEHRDWLMKKYEAGTRRVEAIAKAYWGRPWWWR